MLIANKLLPQGHGLAPALLKRAATLELDWDVRQKSRFETTDSQGRSVGVFLARGSVVRGGDVLVTEDGGLIRVHAAPQAVLVVRHCAEHGSPFDLLRAAYHLGNRHVQLELRPDHLKLEPDHVLAEMLRNMHLIVSEESATFEPEAGAYAAGGHSHAHSQADEPAHEHQPGPAHQHHAQPVARKPLNVPVVAQAPAHVHTAACSHGHAHDHDHHHETKPPKHGSHS